MPRANGLSLEHLAHGSERVGGMVVYSAKMRKVLKAISRFSPHKATSCGSGGVGDGQRTGRASPAYAGLRDRRPVRDLQLLKPGRVAGGIAALRPSARHLYGCPRGFARLFPVGKRWNLVPGRNRRAAAAPAAKAAAGSGPFARALFREIAMTKSEAVFEEFFATMIAKLATLVQDNYGRYHRPGEHVDVVG